MKLHKRVFVNRALFHFINIGSKNKTKTLSYRINEFFFVFYQRNHYHYHDHKMIRKITNKTEYP